MLCDTCYWREALWVFCQKAAWKLPERKSFYTHAHKHESVRAHTCAGNCWFFDDNLDSTLSSQCYLHDYTTGANFPNPSIIRHSQSLLSGLRPALTDAVYCRCIVLVVALIWTIFCLSEIKKKKKNPHKWPHEFPFSASYCSSYGH